MLTNNLFFIQIYLYFRNNQVYFMKMIFFDFKCLSSSPMNGVGVGYLTVVFIKALNVESRQMEIFCTV
jgi:hypothetical protein